MAKRSSSTKKEPKRFCRLPESPPRAFSPDVAPGRTRLIVVSDKKWVNGTTLHYHFFKSPTRWTTTEQRRTDVRRAFKAWKDLGIGLELEEVDSPSEAEIRIGFERFDGHWSYVGRDILNQGVSERTLNLDKSDSWDIDTAAHEIGHSLGFPHEHQNPNAGIVWDEEAVYEALAQPPNEWSRERTHWNILRKIPPDEVQGSSWDPDSVMHYPFGPGLIKQPTKYQNGLRPASGLSERDKAWVQKFYPPLKKDDHQKLEPFNLVRLHLDPAEQANFELRPTATRRYSLGTFGESDSVLVLFEEVNGALRYRTADDDSGLNRNARIRVRLFEGRRYVLRVRLYYRWREGDVGVMMW